MLLAVGSRVWASENHLFEESAGRALGIGADSCWLRVPVTQLLTPLAFSPPARLGAEPPRALKEEGPGECSSEPESLITVL